MSTSQKAKPTAAVGLPDLKPTKAIVAALVSGIIAFLSSLMTALQGPTSSSSGFDSITTLQWLTAILAFFVGSGLAGGATYQVTNRPKA